MRLLTRGLLKVRVQAAALAIMGLLCSSALAVDLKSYPEVTDFHGDNDPDMSRQDWSNRLDNSLDDLADKVKTYPGLTTDLYVPGETQIEHSTGLFPEAAGNITRQTNTSMGELLKERTLPEEVRDTNPYAALTARTASPLRERILTAPRGSLSPADVMGMSLDATNGNYPLATLTALDVLKSAAENGRQTIREMGDLAASLNRNEISQKTFDRKMDRLRDRLRRDSEVVSRLENMRAHPAGGHNDKIGPWYHTFGVLSAGAIHGPLDARVGVWGETLSKRIGYWREKAAGTEAPLNWEKAEIDTRVAWRVFNPGQLGNFQRDWDMLNGPHPRDFIPNYDGGQHPDELAREARCRSANDRVSSIRAQLRGTVQPIHINAARTDLAGFKGQIAECSGLDGRIAGVEKAVSAAAQQWLEGARSARKSCDSEVIRNKAREVSQLGDEPNSSAIGNDLVGAAQSIDQAQEEAEGALADYAAYRDAGDLSGAQKILTRARAALAPLAADGCFAQTRTRIDDLLADIAQRQKITCQELTAQMDLASEQYKTVRAKKALSAVQSKIDDVRSKLDKMDPSSCPEVRERVAKAPEKIKKIGETLGTIEKDLTNCDPRVMERRSKQLLEANHQGLKQLGERFKASVAVAESYQRAKTAYSAGDITEAKKHFEEASRLAKSAGQSTCVDIVDRIGKDLTRISVLTRSDSGGGGADGSGPVTCPTTRAYAYAPDAVIVPTVGDPNSGGPCMPLAGWHLPANARCGVSASAPPKPADVAAGCPVTPTAGGTSGPAPSASIGGGGSGCGPNPPPCPESCTPMDYKCINNQWLGGHCECPKDAF